MDLARGDVVVLADDLIWATRLAALVREAGATPVSARDAASFKLALRGRSRAIVDLTSRAYDGVAAVALAAGLGCAVLCAGQHDDATLWQHARDAGASRVLAYRALHESGRAAIASWLERAASSAGR